MDYICPQNERERDSRGQSFFNKEDQMLTPCASDSSFSLLFVYNHFALHFLLFITSLGVARLCIKDLGANRRFETQQLVILHFCIGF